MNSNKNEIEMNDERDEDMLLLSVLEMGNLSCGNRVILLNSRSRAFMIVRPTVLIVIFLIVKLITSLSRSTLSFHFHLLYCFICYGWHIMAFAICMCCLRLYAYTVRFPSSLLITTVYNELWIFYKLFPISDYLTYYRMLFVIS